MDCSDAAVTPECDPPPGDSVVATEEAGSSVSVHPLSRVMCHLFLSVSGKVTHTGLGDDV